MNWDQIEGQWKQMRGHVKSKWAKFTDDDLAGLEAKQADLVGKIQERYGILKDEAERQVDQWLRELKSRPRPERDATHRDADRPRAIR